MTRREDQSDSPSNGGAAVVERRSLLPAAMTRRSVLLRQLRARDVRNKSLLGTIQKRGMHNVFSLYKDDSCKQPHSTGLVDDDHHLEKQGRTHIQANEVIEDHSQVETGWNGIFVGVNDDGNDGDDASNKFIKRRLFKQLTNTISLNLKKLLEKAKFVSFRSKRYGSDTSGQPRANDGGNSSGPGNANDGDGSDDDEIDATSKSLMWWRDSLKHSCGEFSCVAIQANQEMEVHSQVETGMNATFVGVYDGHCGPHAAMFIKDHLFQQLINMIRKHRTFSGDVLRGAIKATENGFIAHAETNVESNPLLAVSGSSCLVGVIWKGTLHIANVGDSCAVLCSEEHKTHTIIAEKLTTEHNVRNRTIRTELKLMYPNDANIVLKVNEIDGWRVKGISELSRSVGDIYLKRPDFTVPTSVPQKYRLPEPISEAVLTAEPTLFSRALTISDRFIIFASRAFWDLVSIDKAADIVWKNPRAGIARKLLKTALKDKNDVTFDDLEMLGRGSRHSFLDDITVIVIYLDHHLLGIKDITVPVASLKSFNDSEFRSIEELM